MLSFIQAVNHLDEVGAPVSCTSFLGDFHVDSRTQLVLGQSNLLDHASR